MTARPDTLALIAALYAGARSPCAKSRRGVAAFNPRHRLDVSGPSAAEGYRFGSGHNYPPLGTCKGNLACREVCSKRCVHAEAVVLLRLPDYAKAADLVHVKMREDVPKDWSRFDGLLADPAELDALVEPSGPPSCLPCAVLIAAESRVEAIWLYHRDDLPDIPAGWRRWESAEFLARTIEETIGGLR